MDTFEAWRARNGREESIQDAQDFCDMINLETLQLVIAQRQLERAGEKVV
jgi:hypothetical protein